MSTRTRGHIPHTVVIEGQRYVLEDLLEGATAGVTAKLLYMRLMGGMDLETATTLPPQKGAAAHALVCALLQEVFVAMGQGAAWQKRSLAVAPQTKAFSA